MKIRPATNHSSWEIDYDHFSSKKTEFILSRGDRINSPVYFDVPNST